MKVTSTSLRELGEKEVLDRLLCHLPRTTHHLLLGPGDDCAVVRRDDHVDTLLKADAVAEGIHFTTDTPPRLIGRKALARALSDIAAMGGIPEHALITLVTHPQRSVEDLEEIYAGLSEIAAVFGVSIAGGETCSLPTPGLVVNVALTGRVEHGRSFLRSGGKPGDILCVSGALGGSFASGRHLTFTPRIELARALQFASPRPHAVMDLSDGLAADLPRLAAASGCGYEIDEASLPLHTGCTPAQALHDGEDYELLLALPPDDAEALCARFNLTAIGRLAQKTSAPLSGGWQHFTSSPRS